MERHSRNQPPIGPPVLGGLKVGICQDLFQRLAENVVIVGFFFFKLGKYVRFFFLLFCSPILFSVL